MPAAPPADARRGVRDDPGRPSRPPGYGSGGGEARARPCSRQTLVGVALSRPPDVEPQALARTPMGECRVYLREGRRHCWRKRSRSPRHLPRKSRDCIKASESHSRYPAQDAAGDKEEGPEAEKPLVLGVCRSLTGLRHTEGWRWRRGRPTAGSREAGMGPERAHRRRGRAVRCQPWPYGRMMGSVVNGDRGSGRGRAAERNWGDVREERSDDWEGVAELVVWTWGFASV